MAQQRFVNVSYPQKKKLQIPKTNPAVVVVIIILVLGLAWFLFFRPEATDESTQESEKQEEATPSAKPKEATPSGQSLDTKVDTSNWYEYKDVKETFSIKVPKGWFFDKTVKGLREQGKVLGGVADFDFTEKEFDPEGNFFVYFEQDSKEAQTSLADYATKIACIRSTDIVPQEEVCQNPSPPASQKTIKVADKNAIWQEIHGLEGIGIEVYVPKSETEIFVLYTAGKVDKTDGEFKVKQEFVDIVEGMLSTFKFTD